MSVGTVRFLTPYERNRERQVFEHYFPEGQEEINIGNGEHWRGLLKCSICHGCFVNPVVTPCMHRFCCECIMKNLDQGYVSGSMQDSVNKQRKHRECPLCKEPIPSRRHIKEDVMLNSWLSTITPEAALHEDNTIFNSHQQKTLERLSKQTGSDISAALMRQEKRAKSLQSREDWEEEIATSRGKDGILEANVGSLKELKYMKSLLEKELDANFEDAKIFDEDELKNWNTPKRGVSLYIKPHPSQKLPELQSPWLQFDQPDKCQIYHAKVYLAAELSRTRKKEGVVFTIQPEDIQIWLLVDHGQYREQMNDVYVAYMRASPNPTLYYGLNISAFAAQPR
eukprot:Nk52_evm39s239 gene=Nk52_evmTU39s239